MPKSESSSMKIAEWATIRNRIRDLLVIIPVISGVIFLSPILNVLNDDGKIFGVPKSVMVLFGIWLLIIFLIALVGNFVAKYFHNQDEGPSSTR